MMDKIYKFLIIFSLGIFFAEFTNAQNPIHPPLNLVFDDQIYKLNFEVNKNIITKIPRYFLVIGEKEIPIDLENELLPQKNSGENLVNIKTTFNEKISREYLKKLFNEISGFEAGHEDIIRINRDKNGKIQFSGTPKSVYDINFDKFYYLVNQAFLKKAKYVRIPAKKRFTKVQVLDKKLQKQGIKEIITIGESNFAGSSWARMKNIQTAAKLYNGIIVPKGQIFSFNDILQDVSKERGFVEELVIKGNKTEKEYGGGVCQVSTTAFRAAFFGGLEIKRRRSHSYAVPYYKPYGLDATIYLDVQDFRFKNDTAGDLLIQTIFDKDEKNLKFIFYGTKDNRQVEIHGPYISNYQKAPNPIIEKTDQLPVGERYMTSYAHDGFNARWKRIVTKNKEKEVYILNSEYRPWPARILEGVPSKELNKKIN